MRISGVRLIDVRVVDASVRTQNLAIWIDADNAASYPGTGTVITDLSGNGRTQNINNAAAYTVLSGVKCWDCSNTYVIFPTTIGPTLPAGGYTYIIWARMKSSSSTFRTLIRTNPDDHPLLINFNTNDLGMWDNNAPLNEQFKPAGYSVGAFADVWAQWAVAGSNLGQAFYINGQQVGLISATPAGNNHNTIGNHNAAQGFGYVASMFMYTAQLTQEQIQQNYLLYRSRFGV